MITMKCSEDELLCNIKKIRECGGVKIYIIKSKDTVKKDESSKSSSSPS